MRRTRSLFLASVLAGATSPATAREQAPDEGSAPPAGVPAPGEGGGVRIGAVEEQSEPTGLWTEGYWQRWQEQVAPSFQPRQQTKLLHTQRKVKQRCGIVQTRRRM